MLVRYIIPPNLSLWPFLFGHCFLSLLLQLTQGDLQKSCSGTAVTQASATCRLTCQCRLYPPLPPPPPPPPPPRLLGSEVEPSEVPLLKPWWKEMVLQGTMACASVVFLLLTALICYKAIKRKPLRKDENGTSRGEYAMSSRNQKGLDTNNVVV